MICLNDTELIIGQVGHNFPTTYLACLLVIEEANLNEDFSWHAGLKQAFN